MRRGVLRGGVWALVRPGKWLRGWRSQVWRGDVVAGVLCGLRCGAARVLVRRRCGFACLLLSRAVRVAWLCLRAGLCAVWLGGVGASWAVQWVLANACSLPHEVGSELLVPGGLAGAW